MLQLPDGFDLAQLFSDLFTLAAPFVSITFFMACGYLINKALKKLP